MPCFKVPTPLLPYTRANVLRAIQELEKQLILEENKLRDAQDSVQEKGQMGFLRMAAQVDNFRKTSGAGTGDYEADAKAAVLEAMLPAFEPFEAAKEVGFVVRRRCCCGGWRDCFVGGCRGCGWHW